MTLKNVTVNYDAYLNGEKIHPFVPELTFSDVITNGWNKLTVSASASDEALAITDLGTINLLELRVLPADKSKITVKYNGSSKAYSVSPVEITSENITAITGSNSTTSAVDLFWRPIFS